MATRKKRLAIVSNVTAPYRVSQHLRILRELGDDVELLSLARIVSLGAAFSLVYALSVRALFTSDLKKLVRIVPRSLTPFLVRLLVLNRNEVS